MQVQALQGLGAAVALASLLVACSGEAPKAARGAATVAVSADATSPAPKAEALAATEASAARALGSSALIDTADLEVAGVSDTKAPSAPASARELEPVSLGELPPELARALFVGPGGRPLDALDDLAIAFEEGPDDPLPLVLGGTSVVEEPLGDGDALDAMNRSATSGE